MITRLSFGRVSHLAPGHTVRLPPGTPELGERCVIVIEAVAVVAEPFSRSWACANA